MEGYRISAIILVVILTLAYGRRVQNPCARENKIPCDNGECIQRYNWCDTEFECSDQSDEKYCKRRQWDSEPFNNCTEKHFACGDGMCVPASVRCDGDWDCYGSAPDEDDCETIDRDEPIYTSESTTEYYAPTSTSVFRTTYVYPTSPATTEYYDRRRTDESYENKRYNYNPPLLVYPSYHDNNGDNYGSSYPERNHNRRNSDTYPERNFPSNQRPSVQTPETNSRKRPHVTTRPRQQVPRYVDRDPPVVYPSRTILYPPRVSSPIATRRTERRPDLPSFNFEVNYTKDFEYQYRSNILSAKDWLLSQKDVSYTWGRDTPRALIALSLISNSFKSDTEENELLKKSFQTFLGLKILRNETNIEKISTTRLAVYINALLATCQNPFDFWGLNLAEKLYFTQYKLEQNQRFINPLIYLTLCLTNMPVDVRYFQTHIRSSFPTEISKDFHILTTTVLACLAQQNPDDTYVKGKLYEAVRSLLNEMNTDGSFGSKYTTALAAQALMSVNDSQDWNSQRTLDYLAAQQDRDGSFGDMQSTYYTLIALSGRSLVYLRNTQCDPLESKKEWSPADIVNGDGPKKRILFNMTVGYPVSFSTGIQLTVLQNSSFFEVMLAAAHLYPRYKFEYEINSKLDVHTIAGIPSDPERGMFWNLYWLQQTDERIDFKRKYTADIRSLIPQDGDELLYWYLSDRYTY